MNKIKKLSLIFKERKGITGVDIAAAVTVIVLTVGIVTAIYVNAINKSKDNMRYSNAVRIATNIIESIQKRPYEYLTAKCNGESDTCTVNGPSDSKVFDTKIPNGYSATIIASKPGSGADIARDVTVNVTYKTITIKTVKEKELMDMTNPPDFSLIPGYNPSNSSKTFYYPVIKDNGSYKVTTTSDINWYDYEEGNYAIVSESTSGEANIGDTVNGSKLYVWIPRFVAENGTEKGIDKVQFLYGSSNYVITLNQYGDLFSYGVKYNNGTITEDSKPLEYDKTKFNNSDNFGENDGSGVWYEINGTTSNSDDVKKKAVALNSKIKCKNAEIK